MGKLRLVIEKEFEPDCTECFFREKVSTPTEHEDIISYECKCENKFTDCPELEAQLDSLGEQIVPEGYEVNVEESAVIENE